LSVIFILGCFFFPNCFSAIGIRCFLSLMFYLGYFSVNNFLCDFFADLVNGHVDQLLFNNIFYLCLGDIPPTPRSNFLSSVEFFQGHCAYVCWENK